MAYVGLAKPVIAKYRKAENSVDYSEGFRFGKAVKIEINPNYEDISDYSDINDTDHKERFVNADIKLGITDIPIEAEKILFGHEIYDNGSTSHCEDTGGYVGLGIRTQEVVNGIRKYVAVWMHKVKLKETGAERETKGETMAYKTPEVEGTAEPDDAGNWRTKKIFETGEEADAWLNVKAGIQE